MLEIHHDQGGVLPRRDRSPIEERRQDPRRKREEACAGSVSTCDERVRSTGITILVGVFSSNAMPLPTSAGRFACLQRVLFPWRAVRVERPRMAPTGTTRAHTGAHGPRIWCRRLGKGLRRDAATRVRDVDAGLEAATS